MPFGAALIETQKQDKGAFDLWLCLLWTGVFGISCGKALHWGEPEVHAGSVTLGGFPTCFMSIETKKKKENRVLLHEEEVCDRLCSCWHPCGPEGVLG